MKKLLLIVLILSGIRAVKAQVTLFPENGAGVVEYQNVVELNGTKDRLYNSAKQWIAKTFANPADVLKMDDFETGIIKLTYNSQFIEGYSITQSMEIEIKDNKYRYTVNNIYLPVPANIQDNMTAEGINRRIREKTDKGKKPLKFLTDCVVSGDIIVKTMIASLNNGMKTSDTF